MDGIYKLSTSSIVSWENHAEEYRRNGHASAKGSATPRAGLFPGAAGMVFYTVS
jgi:hypothetical protein